jgi:hypothetical protein
MEEIMKETTALLQRKTASFKGTNKKALAGEDPASIPGAEHDGTPPAGSTEAQPEVADATMGPKSTRSAEGGGDDSEVTRGHATDATEGEVPPAKPLITGDANAKAARCAQIGNDIMADIRNWRKGAAAPKAAAPAAAPKAPAQKAAAAPKAAAPAPAAVAPKTAAPKEAEGFNMELTEKVLAKIAAICLSYEDTAAVVTAALEKHAGETQAEEIMGFLAAQDAEYTKQAAEAAGYADGMALVNQQLYARGVAAGKAASAKAPVQVKAPAQKVAAAPKAVDAAHIASLMKLGQQLAEQGLGDIMGALPNEQGAPMGAAPAGMDPAAMGMDPAAMGMDPAAAAGAGGEEFSVEDLAAALDVLVSQQQISPEDAQQILQQVTSESAGAPMSGEGEPTGAAVAEPAGQSEPGEAAEAGEGEGEEKGEAAEKETPAEESKEGKAQVRK